MSAKTKSPQVSVRSRFSRTRRFGSMDAARRWIAQDVRVRAERSGEGSTWHAAMKMVAAGDVQGAVDFLGHYEVMVKFGRKSKES